MKNYGILNEYQHQELTKKGYITLNGCYSQEYNFKGTKKQCEEYINEHKLLENNYDRFLLWKYKTTFYVTFGNN